MSVSDADSFWHVWTIDELAALQGVEPIRSLDDVLGGWPEDELDDGFEDAVSQWRAADPENRR
jgi:hypothetical protein